MQGLVARGLTLEEIWNIDVNYVKVTAANIQVRSPGQGICQVSTLRRSTLQGLMVVGLIVGDIERRRKICQSHWSAKYRSRSPGQGTCQVSTSRRSTMQGLVIVCL